MGFKKVSVDDLNKDADKVSLRPYNVLYFPVKLLKKFNIKEASFAILHVDEEQIKLGVEFIGKDNGDALLCKVHRSSNGGGYPIYISNIRKLFSLKPITRSTEHTVTKEGDILVMSLKELPHNRGSEK